MPEAPIAREEQHEADQSDRDEDHEADEDRKGDHLAPRHVERRQRERDPSLEGAEESGRRRNQSEEASQDDDERRFNDGKVEP